jgi:DNA mismatch endonuclease, patch repair protein
MTDVHSKQVRSYNMSRIRSKDTKPEMLVRRFLFSKGYRYRLHDKKLPGKPDLVLPKYKTVIFIHGCFWHSHENCKYFVAPKTHTDWWLSKLDANKLNDKSAEMNLLSAGWNIILIWECELKKMNSERTLENLTIKLEAGH